MDKSNKQILGEYAVKKFVADNMIVGLGTGSTAIWAVREIAHKIANAELKNIRCGITSPGTQLEALALGIPIFDLNSIELQKFDLVLDGADEVDDQHNMTKGGGGCLLHEKIVAYNSDLFVCMIDKTKQVKHLGQSFAIPIEVIPASLNYVKKQIQALEGSKEISLRLDARNIGPWITQEGNYIIDVFFKQEFDCASREKQIVSIVGVVECGIFSTQHMGFRPSLCVYDEKNPENIVQVIS